MHTTLLKIFAKTLEQTLILQWQKSERVKSTIRLIFLSLTYYSTKQFQWKPTYIRFGSVHLKSPEVVARSTETSLHFIGNIQTTLSLNHFGSSLHEAFRQLNVATSTLTEIR